MGCCCLKKPEFQADQEIVNQSRVRFDKDKTSQDWRDQGKIFYNSKQYEKATQAYEKALSINPLYLANYTNLALAMKASQKFYQSIETIDKMEEIPSYDEKDKKIIVKGKIIRARCQTILAKNFCVEENPRIQKAVCIAEAKKLIKLAIQSLSQITQNCQKSKNYSFFNAFDFLKNARKVEKYLNIMGKKSEQREFLFKYLIPRLKQAEAKQGKPFQKVSDMIEQPLQIIPFLENCGAQKDKLQILEDEEEQFTTDPITYERLINPILLKTGLTYEEKSLKKHFQKNGTHDPITREQLVNQLGVSNRTLSAFISQKNFGVNKDDLIFAQY